MGDSYYPFFPGDYLRDTLQLTMEQDGAYRRLLDHYYNKGPLPADRDMILNIARAMKENEKASVDSVVRMYFRLDGEVYRNKKADEVIMERTRFLEAQTAKGKKGAAKRWGKEEEEMAAAIPEGLPGLMPGHMPGHRPNDGLPPPPPPPPPDLSPDPPPKAVQEHLSGNDAPDASIPYDEIIGFLNREAGKSFNPKAEASRKHIRARWKEGHRIPDFKEAVLNQVKEWKGTKMEFYLRPSTLFNCEKFDGYINNTGKAKADEPRGLAAIRALRAREGR